MQGARPRGAGRALRRLHLLRARRQGVRRDADARARGTRQERLRRPRRHPAGRGMAPTRPARHRGVEGRRLRPEPGVGRRRRSAPQELAHALATGKRIVPVVRRTVQPRELPAHLTAPNWIWLRDEDDAAAGEQALVAALELDEEWLDAHARLTVRAREWDDAARDRSFLLRGSDLEAAEQWLARQGEHASPRRAIQVQYILDSRQAASRRRRGTFGAVLAALAIAVALAVVALVAAPARPCASRRPRSRASSPPRPTRSSTPTPSSASCSPPRARGSRRRARRRPRCAPRCRRRTSTRRRGWRSCRSARPRSAPTGATSSRAASTAPAASSTCATARSAALLRPRGLPKAQAELLRRRPGLRRGVRARRPPRRDGELRRRRAGLGLAGAAGRRDAARRVGKVRLAFSPDGRTLAAGVDAVGLAPRPRAQLSGLATAFHSLVAFDARGRSVAAAAVFGGAARVGRPHAAARSRGCPRRRTTTPRQSIAFAADARRLVRGTGDGVAEVWDWRRAADARAAAAGRRVRRDARSHATPTVLVGTTDGKIRVWDWEAGDVSAASCAGIAGRSPASRSRRDGQLSRPARTARSAAGALPARGVTLPAPARRFVTSADIGRRRARRGRGRADVPGALRRPAPRRRDLRRAQWRAGSPTLAERPSASATHEPWLRVELSPDGRFVAGASDSGIVHVWDWRARREVALLRHGATVRRRSGVQPGRRLLATTTTDRGVLRLVVARAPRAAPARARRPDPAGRSPATSTSRPTATSSSWRRAASCVSRTGGAGSVLARFCAACRRGRRELRPHGRPRRRRRRRRRRARLDWRSGRTLAELRGGGAVKTATFSPDGGAAAHRRPRRGDRLGLAPRAAHPRSASAAAQAVRRRTPAIGDARFSADAKRIVTAGNDNRAHLYACDGLRAARRAA